jgi:hypothetical protein
MFYKPETEKTKLNQTEPKPKKTEQNRFEQVFVLKNRTETDLFEPVSVRFQFFFKKNSIWLFFFYKNQIKPKIITPTRNCLLTKKLKLIVILLSSNI